MALESDFLQMSTQVVTINALSTHTAYGAPSFSTSASTFFAYIEPGSRVVVNLQGVEEVASAMVYVLSSSASIGVQDKITLPDGRIPRMIRADILNDEQGQHHVELSID